MPGNRAKPPNSNIIKRFIAKLQSNKGKKDAITSFSLASTNLTEMANPDITYFQKPEGKRALEMMYRNSWAIYKAINVRANLLATRGLKFKYENEQQKKVTETMLKKMHPTRPMLALQNSFKNRSINTDVFGNGYDEILFTPAGTAEKPISPSKATDMLGFTPMHPLNTDFIRVEGGDDIEFEKNSNIPKGFSWSKDPDNQQVDGVELPLDRVGHLKYNIIGDELLGMSTIEPIFKTAERLMKIEEGMAQGILTYGSPTRDFIVGDESHPPDKKMIDNVASTVENFNMKGEYVHPPWIRVGQLESFSLSNFSDYTQPFITAIAASTGVPEFILLGRGEGTNKATAQAMIDFIHQTIMPLQQAQALYFEESILAPLMKIHKVEGVPSIEWNDILPKNLADYANVIKTLSETMVGDKQIITREEAREMAGFVSEKYTSGKKGETAVRLTKSLK